MLRSFSKFRFGVVIIIWKHSILVRITSNDEQFCGFVLPLHSSSCHVALVEQLPLSRIIGELTEMARELIKMAEELAGMAEKDSNLFFANIFAEDSNKSHACFDAEKSLSTFQR